MMSKSAILREFCQIPGVGKTIAEDFWALGLRSLDDLKGEDAEALLLKETLNNSFTGSARNLSEKSSILKRAYS